MNNFSIIWNEQTFKIIQINPFDKDESKVDYSEDLKILLEMCKDKFIDENVEEIQKGNLKQL